MIKFKKDKSMNDLIEYGFKLESTSKGSRYVKYFPFTNDLLVARRAGEVVIVPVTREVYITGTNGGKQTGQEELSLVGKLINDGLLGEE